MADKEQPVNSNMASNSQDDIQTPYDTETELPFDAKVMEEEIEGGEVAPPPAHIESDYEASKQFSQSDRNNQKTSKKAAFEPTVPAPSNSADESINYREMAKEVNPNLSE
ncbi:MAG TPA: hypothetical protein V6C65_31095 [Allocoleopsis sp.]